VEAYVHTNRLANEKSPYLLQHAHNPVDWYPWGPEAFEKARTEQKPIFLSIGYSTCHWCHVMERESFENEEIAGILNREFVPVKVDREERPDVDRIYMAFVQAATGGGGWPMSVWLTPELRPFFGGTYFPPEDRWGRAGFATVLRRVAEAWHDEHDKIAASSVEVLEQLEQQTAAQESAAVPLDRAVLESAFYAFRRSYDTRYGGFGGAPKFPRPVVYNFLLRYWVRTRNKEALEMVLATLRAMARGGMHDQLGGGFHRYAVDERWRVPHFEKMLYDQAQLAASYVEAFQITGESQYAETARRTLDYVIREMRDESGGFYSAEDADSALDAAHPEDKREGAYYVWTREEIERVAGSPAAEWFCYRYGVKPEGNAEADPHGEFAGKNILCQAHTVEETARDAGRGVDEVRDALRDAGRKLLAARERRPRPHRDDKVLAAWNGLAISALARAGAALGEPVYTDAAVRAAEFVTSRMYDAAGGVLLRRYRQGEAAIPGFLDDYALVAQACLDLYESVFELRWLELAQKLAEDIRRRFEDPAEGGFFSSSGDDSSLVMRIKDDYDGAEPSGNSVAILMLLRLAALTGRAEYRQSAERALRAFAPRMAELPQAVPHMLAACEFALGTPREVVVVGDRSARGTQALLEVVHRRFLPGQVTMLVDGPEARRTLSANLPEIAGMGQLDGGTAAYVCENYACRLPVSDPERLTELLQ
jgi:uncharacterized protein YyaL (SSP411 family)